MAHRRRSRWTSLLLSLPLLLLSTAAQADAYESKDAGHPVRIAAYVLHPVGVALDYVILRPAHWVVSREPWRTLFGH